jgi:hypothetical protein
LPNGSRTPARRVETITVRDNTEEGFRLGLLGCHTPLTVLLPTFGLFKRRDAGRVLDRNPTARSYPAGGPQPVGRSTCCNTAGTPFTRRQSEPWTSIG